jgi:hypothetical protein
MRAHPKVIPCENFGGEILKLNFFLKMFKKFRLH